MIFLGKRAFTEVRRRCAPFTTPTSSTLLTTQRLWLSSRYCSCGCWPLFHLLVLRSADYAPIIPYAQPKFTKNNNTTNQNRKKQSESTVIIDGGRATANKETGTIEVGKRADLVLIEGDLSKDVTAIRNMEIVFKNGIGFDSKKIFESVKGKVGAY